MQNDLLAVGILAVVALKPCSADELKYHDKDLIYDETRVAAYDLPPLLVSSEGKPIGTAEEWFNIRQAQIISLFGNLVYEIVPVPDLPLKASFEVVKMDRHFMNGAATQKDVRIRFENAKGKAEC